MSTFLGDLMHPAGKYLKDGEEKTRWLKVGAVFRNDRGGLRIKLEAIPADMSETGGWLSVFEKEQNTRPQQAPTAAAPAQGDVPF